MSEKRREPRYGVEVDARLRNGTGSARSVKVTNLSARGCRFSLPGEGLGIGAFVTITVARVGFLDARVRWRAGSTHGLRFEHPLHPAVLDHIRYFLSREPALVEEASPSALVA